MLGLGAEALFIAAVTRLLLLKFDPNSSRCLVGGRQINRYPTCRLHSIVKGQKFSAQRQRKHTPVVRLRLPHNPVSRTAPIIILPTLVIISFSYTNSTIFEHDPAPSDTSTPSFAREQAYFRGCQFH